MRSDAAVSMSNEPHREVGMDSMIKSGSLGGIMVSTLTQNARGVGSISTLGPVFPTLNTSMTSCKL